MGIIQLTIFVTFILVYVAIVGVLAVRVASRSATGFYQSGDQQDQEVPLEG